MNNKGNLLKKWIIAIVCLAVTAFAIPLVTTVFLADDDGPVVIVLDPGHGGLDVGAVNYRDGLNEADANLAIALACRDELLKYDNVEVYMTHTGLDRSIHMSLSDRVACVQVHDADILVSLHCNDSVNPESNGAEVYVSHSTYKDTYNSKSSALAVEFLREFRDLGLEIRGIKTRLSNGERVYYHDDGSVEIGDYYAVIGTTIKRYGVPGILVEHGFVTGDYNFFDSPEDLAALGIADAHALAAYYNLPLKGEGGQIYDEPEAILVTDMDIASASDVNAALLSIPDVPSVMNYNRMQEIRADYESLTIAGKTLIDTDHLNRLYAFLPELDRRMYPVRIEALEESELSVDRIKHIVSGLDLASGGLAGTNVSQLMSMVYIHTDTAYATEEDAFLGDVVLAVTDSSMENTLDIGTQVGTGCCVSLYRNGEVIDSLSVVITCDLSGDGIADSRDQLLLENYLRGELELSEPVRCAADVNMDGLVNDVDLNLLLHRIVGEN